MIDKLTVNGTDLETRSRIVESWDGARGITARRTANVIIPNRDGELWVPKARQAKVFTVGLHILGVDPQTGTFASTADARRRQFNANWRDFVRLIAPSDKPITLGRVTGYPGGIVEKQTAQAEVDGEVVPDMVTPDVARVAVSFKLLDGVWFGDSAEVNTRATVAAANGARDFAVTCPGDAVTWQLGVEITGTGTSRLTNTTTGDWVQVTDATGTVLLDVPNYRASTDGVSVIDKITTGDTQLSPYWMTLAPGPNQLTFDGPGTFRITYRGAYL